MILGFLIYLSICAIITEAAANSTEPWDPCLNVYKFYHDCFLSDLQLLNKACAYGTNEKFEEGLKNGSASCQFKYGKLKKTKGAEIKVGDPCVNIDTKLKSCSSSDRDSVKTACEEKSPEKIGKAFVDFSLTCRTALKDGKEEKII